MLSWLFNVGFSTLFGLITVVLPIFWFQTHFLPFPSFLLDCGTRDEPRTPALWNMDLTAGSVVLFYSETKFHKTEANQKIFSSKYGFPKCSADGYFLSECNKKTFKWSLPLLWVGVTFKSFFSVKNTTVHLCHQDCSATNSFTCFSRPTLLVNVFIPSNNLLLQKLNHWGALQITLRGYFRKKIVSDLDLLLLGRKLTGENAYLSTWSSLIIPWALHYTDPGRGEKCHQVLAWGKVSVDGNRSHLCVLWGLAAFGWEPWHWSYREKSSPWCCWVVVEPLSSSEEFSSSECLWVPTAALWGNSRWISLWWKVSYSWNRGMKWGLFQLMYRFQPC